MNIPGLFPLTVKHVDKVVVIAGVVVAEVVVVVLPTFPSHPGHPFPHTPHSPWMWTPRLSVEVEHHGLFPPNVVHSLKILPRKMKGNTQGTPKQSMEPIVTVF